MQRKEILMLDTKKLLLEFSALTGVSGLETGPAAYGAKLLGEFGRTELTPLGSVVCAVRPPREGEGHILLEAHMDEIGMIVTYIDDKGFLKVQACGGVDRRILSAYPVTVHTQNGPIEGVVCSTPPHLSAGDHSKKNAKIEEISIDIGYSKEAAECRVSLGDRVTLNAPSRPLLGDIVTGKALDDRAGCVSLLKALEYLSGRSLNCGLTVAFTAMEEVGGMGAKTTAYAVAPTHSVSVDVSFAHTPDAAKEKCGVLGKGPMIGFAPVLSAKMSRDFVELAKKNKIPFQCEVMGGRTGTNADAVATARGGVAAGLISIPQRYMHTPIEAVSAEDVENTAKLIAAYVNTFERQGKRP